MDGELSENQPQIWGMILGSSDHTSPCHNCEFLKSVTLPVIIFVMFPYNFLEEKAPQEAADNRLSVSTINFTICSLFS